MKKLIYILVIVVAYYAYEQFLIPDLPVSNAQPSSAQSSQAREQSSQASEQWRSGQQVQGTGTAVRVLSDDDDGSRHQRFILRMSSGQTLLIAHNIDLALRVSSLRAGDTVAFFGEYETNSQGGVIHWTRRDPQGRHAERWLEHEGRRYQ